MNIKVKKTRKAYEEYLNNNSSNDIEQYVIGGKLRSQYYYKNKFGTAIRKYDPIGFEVGYNEWRM